METIKMNEKMKLNIQLFAEGEEVDTSNVSVEEPKAEESEPSFVDLLKNPKYQAEFDKMVAKSINTAKTNWQKDYDAKLQAEKTEAEKLAKMDADQRLKYELNKEKSEKAELQSKLNAINLYKTASDIAVEKELPVGYLDLIDFSKESAETITSKIEKLQELRNKDLQSYLNNKLRQPTPQEKQDVSNTIDPYIVGFESEI